MLSVSYVYELLLDAIRSDKRGLALEIDEFNRIIRLVNQEVYDEYVTLFESSTTNSDVLAGLKVHNYGIDLVPLVSASVAYGTMPTAYYQVIGKPRILDGTTVRFVDEVTEFEDNVREEDFLTKASITYPTCRIGGVNGSGQIQIKVRPQTITKIWIDYLKETTIPFLDYYVNNTTFKGTLLPMSATAQSLPIGTTYRSGTAGGTGVTVASITKNLDWGEGDLSIILSKLIQKVGALLPDQGLVQTGLAEEIKNKE